MNPNRWLNIWIYSCVIFVFLLIYRIFSPHFPLSELIESVWVYIMFTVVGIGSVTFIIFFSLAAEDVAMTKGEKKRDFVFQISMGVFIVVIGLVGFFFLKREEVSESNSPYVATKTELKSPPPNTFADSEVYSANEVELAINEYRKSKGLSELKRHDPLCDLAKIRVYEIQDDWSHEGFEARKNGELFDRFCNIEKIRCTAIGENLAEGFYSAEAVMNGWETSVKHNQNMLYAYNVQCVAIDEGYVVSLFAYTTVEPISTFRNNTFGTMLLYDRGEIDKWEELIALDKKSRDSWEGARNSDWYDREKVERLLSKFGEAIDIGETILNGYINSSISTAKYEELNSRRNALIEETNNLTAELNQGAYEECKDDYAELAEETGEEYDDSCDDFR